MRLQLPVVEFAVDKLPLSDDLLASWSCLLSPIISSQKSEKELTGSGKSETGLNRIEADCTGLYRIDSDHK